MSKKQEEKLYRKLTIATHVTATIILATSTIIATNGTDAFIKAYDRTNPEILTNFYSYDPQLKITKVTDEYKEVELTIDIKVENPTKNNNTLSIYITNNNDKGKPFNELPVEHITPEDLSNLELDGIPEITKTFRVKKDEDPTIDIYTKTNKLDSATRKYDPRRFMNKFDS